MTKTRIVDKYNPDKIWLVTHYSDGHYTVNQEICGYTFYSKNQRIKKGFVVDLMA